MKAKSPLDIYRYLPKTNCMECGTSCMGFATNLIQRKQRLEECPHLKERAKRKIAELIEPNIKEIEFENLKIGGEEVLFRHELTFFNKPPILIKADETNWRDVLRGVKEYKKIYVGKELKLDGILLEFKSDVDSYLEALKGIDHNVVLIAPTDVLKKALEIRRTVIGYANVENYDKFLNLAKEFDVPVIVKSDDLRDLKFLAMNFKREGVKYIVNPILDTISKCYDRVLKVRVTGMEGDEDFACPIMVEIDFDDVFYSVMASMTFVCRYADLIAINKIDPLVLMPTLVLRENIYTDPRVPVAVESGLYEIGKPDGESPLFVTTNFMLTFYTVKTDLESAGVNCYLLVIDTGGICVGASVASGRFSADAVKEAMEKFKVDEKVNHRKIILPGLASRLKGAIEDVTGWEVLVGPIDSSAIKDWLDKVWS
jgi:acetyl-CoA decarbonylase/synthase complex subunit gamma